MKICSICAAAMEMKPLPAVTAEESPLKVTVQDMPAFVCPKSHKTPVHRDFLLWLIREIRARESQLPFGKSEGMLFKKHLCGACGKELAGKSERRQSFAFDLAYPESPAFKMQLELPVYKCSACGKEQARSAKDLSGNAAGAVASLNDAAGFPHSG